MAEPELALAFTPEPWVQEFHRHCTDHGGARVRQIVMDAALVLEDAYDALVASHRWPPLSRGLVDDLHARGRIVVGVYDAPEPEGCAYLESIGVDATVASDAPAAEIVAVVAMLVPSGSVARAFGAQREVAFAGKRAQLFVVGGPSGGGRTEVALALAARFAAVRQRTVLVDGDDVAPALAVRLGLPIEPNLADLVEASEHGVGGDAVTRLPVANLAVVAGLPSGAAWARVRPAEVARGLERLRQGCDVVVADSGPAVDETDRVGGRARHALARRLLSDAEAVVAVAAPTPVGVVRLLAWLASARGATEGTPLVIAVNRAPRDAFRRRELSAELRRAGGGAPVVLLPEDHRAGAAAWAGTTVPRGPFARAIDRLAATLVQHRGEPPAVSGSLGDAAERRAVAS